MCVLSNSVFDSVILWCNVVVKNGILECSKCVWSVLLYNLFCIIFGYWFLGIIYLRFVFICGLEFVLFILVLIFEVGFIRLYLGMKVFY